MAEKAKGSLLMKDLLVRLWKYVSEDIWDVELTSLSGMKRLGIKSLRVVHLVFRGFKQGRRFPMVSNWNTRYKFLWLGQKRVKIVSHI